MRSVTGWIAVMISTCALAGCANEAEAPTAAPVPKYEVVSTKDVSFGAVRRLDVRVSLPQHYSRDIVERVAKAVVANITKSQPVNAISILFYGPATPTAGAYDVARVEWAPNGRWEDADKVQAGEYSAFAYSISYSEPTPVPAPPQSSLKPSGKNGLLGVPLPVGATLSQRQRGDREAGRDPSERYAMSASAPEIAAFFNEAMPAAGWAKDGSSTGTALFFRKGRLMIGVLINSQGGTFTLMGS